MTTPLQARRDRDGAARHHRDKPDAVATASLSHATTTAATTTTPATHRDATTPPSLSSSAVSHNSANARGKATSNDNASRQQRWRHTRSDMDNNDNDEFGSNNDGAAHARDTSTSQCTADTTSNASSRVRRGLRKKYVTTTVTTVTTTSILLPRMQDVHMAATQLQPQHQQQHALTQHDVQATRPLLQAQATPPSSSPCEHVVPASESSRAHGDDKRRRPTGTNGRVDAPAATSQNVNNNNNDSSDTDNHHVQQWHFTQHSARTVERDGVCYDAAPTLAQLGIAHGSDSHHDNSNNSNDRSANYVVARHVVQSRERFVQQPQQPHSVAASTDATPLSPHSLSARRSRPVLLHESREEVEGGGRGAW